MYTVVGCGECGSLWIVDGRPETTTCRRCGKRHRFDALRPLARTETQDAAREARSGLLADRADDLPADHSIAPAADRSRSRAGVDPGGSVDRSARIEDWGSPRTIVRRAIRHLDHPTIPQIIEYATRRDVPESEARRTLERLVRSGEVTEAEGTFRLL